MRSVKPNLSNVSNNSLKTAIAFGMQAGDGGLPGGALSRTALVDRYNVALIELIDCKARVGYPVEEEGVAFASLGSRIFAEQQAEQWEREYVLRTENAVREFREASHALFMSF